LIGFSLAIGGYLTFGTLILILRRGEYYLSLVAWAFGGAGLTSLILRFIQQGAFVWHVGGRGGIEMRCDLPALLFGGLVLSLNLATLLYMGKKEEGTFYALYNYLLATAFSLELSHDLFNIYVSIELLSLISILLIGYGKKTYQIWAGLKYLILSSLSMSLYLLGVALVYRISGTLSIGALKSEELVIGKGLKIGLALMVVGLAVKGGIFFFSMWLPEAHASSETVVSALLSGMAIKGGIFGILRVAEIADLGALLIVLGGATGIFGALYALMAKTPKKILSFHTMSQMSYILIGFGSSSALGILGASLHLVFHGLFKGLLFLSAGASGAGRRSLYSLEGDIPGSAKLGLVVGSLSIVALPPFDAFFSKSLCMEGISSLGSKATLLAIGLGTVTSFVKLNWYMLRTGTSYSFFKGKSIVLLSLLVLGSAAFLPPLLETAPLHLLGSEHLAESLITFFLGTALFFFLKEKLKKTSLWQFPFSLGNSVCFFFGGLLFVALFLLYMP